ncbi:MAG: hypothetical protein WAM97_15885, partial [Acidimicrobiales bacterium]
VFTFEARVGRAQFEPRLAPRILDRVHAITLKADVLRTEESELRLFKTRRPEIGFSESALRWSSGERLDRVLERSALPPGDFVRNAKQLSDLLRQISIVSESAETRQVAIEAVDSVQRGVVRAGWVGTLGDPDPEEQPSRTGPEQLS